MYCNTAHYTNTNYSMQIFRDWEQWPQINVSEIIAICSSGIALAHIIVSTNYYNGGTLSYIDLVYLQNTKAFRINESDLLDFLRMTRLPIKLKQVSCWLKEGF